eukprot:1159769-Pelagomonas_calceolata.AAC.3
MRSQVICAQGLTKSESNRKGSNAAGRGRSHDRAVGRSVCACNNAEMEGVLSKEELHLYSASIHYKEIKGGEPARALRISFCHHWRRQICNPSTKDRTFHSSPEGLPFALVQLPKVSLATHFYPKVTLATNFYPEVTLATNFYPKVTFATNFYPKVTLATTVLHIIHLDLLTHKAMHSAP